MPNTVNITARLQNLIERIERLKKLKPQAGSEPAENLIERIESKL